ncbi:MAG: CHAT domain-containing protein [Planctomycetes bacterium]|nr:CHAT domain-containing protein [Planctomycetota bacterium]
MKRVAIVSLAVFLLGGQLIAAEPPAELSKEAQALKRRTEQALRAFRYADAVAPGDEFLALLRREEQTDHPDFLPMLIYVANAHHVLDNDAKSDSYLHEAFKRVEGDAALEAKYLGSLLSNLGMHCIDATKYDEAKAFFERGLRHEKAQKKVNFEGAAGCYLGLAKAEENLGNPQIAEKHYFLALRIFQDHVGPGSLRVADTCRSIGNFFGTNGDYEKAIENLDLAMQVYTKLQNQHAQVAGTALDLGKYLRRSGNPENALHLYAFARGVLLRAYPPEHVQFLPLDHFTGTLLADLGKNEAALTHYQRVLDGARRLQKTESMLVAGTYANMGYTLLQMNKLEESRKHYLRGAEIMGKLLPPQHAENMHILANLAYCEALMGKKKEATAKLQQASATYDSTLPHVMQVGSEASKLAYLEQLQGKTNLCMFNHLQLNPDDPAAAELAYSVILNRKGRVLEALSKCRLAPRNDMTANEQMMLAQLRTLHGALAGLLTQTQLRGAAGSEAKEKTLRTGIESLERRLAGRLATSVVDAPSPSRAQVASRLGKNTVLLEYFVYRPPDRKIPKAEEHLIPQRLAVYVVLADGGLRWADLGELSPLAEAIGNYRARLQVAQPADQQAAELYRLLVKPVAAHLPRSGTVVIAPDGPLNLLPFATLRDEPGKYLLESYLISYVTSGRDLLRPAETSTAAAKVVVMADPEYGSPQAAAGTQRDAPPISFAFNPLPGTAAEAKLIQSILPAAAIYTGTQATEDRVKELAAPTVLHIATHGFFADSQGQSSHRGLKLAKQPPTQAPAAAPQQPAEAASTKKPAIKASEQSRMRTPLARSGLALAGANGSGQGKEDGILTALEMTGVDLHGTQLVVLSACETGLGEITAGEGVFGMRRAFVIAGAETQVMSLWMVHDDATKELMALYYRGLKAGQGRAQAMQVAQQQMLRGKYAKPTYWGAFIVSGNREPLKL